MSKFKWMYPATQKETEQTAGHLPAEVHVPSEAASERNHS